MAASAADVDALLDDIEASCATADPELVTVVAEATGDSLAIGLGRERSVLNYVSGSLNPPYYTSVGDVQLDEPISFRFGGEWSEFPLSHSVPVSVAREAMRHFCRTGQLTPAVGWEQD